jgi:hypothetical protein
MTWWNCHASLAPAVNAPWPKACCAAPWCALHGLDGRCARRIQNSAQADFMRTSIIAVIRLEPVFVSPRHFAEHVIDAVHEAIAWTDTELSIAIGDGPDKTLIDIWW